MGRGRGDHMGPHGLAELDRGNADAARSTQHQQALTRLQLRPVLQGVPGGSVGHHEGGRRVEIHGVGDLHHRGGGHGQTLDHAAPSGHGDDTVTLADMGHTLADRLDHTRDLAAGREGPGRLELVFVLNDQGVGEIDPDGPDFDHHLALHRPGVQHLLDDKGFGAAGGLGQDCAHQDVFREGERPGSIWRTQPVMDRRGAPAKGATQDTAWGWGTRNRFRAFQAGL